VDSSSFKGNQGKLHINMPMPFTTEVQQAEEVNLGAFRLPPELVGQLENWTPCTKLAPETMRLPPSYSEREFSHWMANDRLWLFSGSGGGELLPEIGDLRVSFERVPCGEATVLAVQAGNSFVPMRWSAKVGRGGVVMLDGADDSDESEITSSCACCGIPCGGVSEAVTSAEEIFRMASGRRPAGQLLRAVEKDQGRLYTCLKCAGFLCIVGGLGLMGCVVPALFRVVPYVGTWIEQFGKIVFWVFALAFGVALGYITVALAWLRARPLKALLLLILSGGLASAPWVCRAVLRSTGRAA